MDPCPGLSPVVVSKPTTEVKARSVGITQAEKCPLPLATMHQRKAERFLHLMAPQDSHSHP